jgi:hypothetical protein
MPGRSQGAILHREVARLTPIQAAQHTWKPDEATWTRIKEHSAASPATVTIGAGAGAAHIRIATSRDPVGAPIFYRDVPLMPSELEKGVIKPLAESNVPLIAWRLRNIAEPARFGRSAYVREWPIPQRRPENF